MVLAIAVVACGASVRSKLLVERLVADQRHLDGLVAQRDRRLVGRGFVPTTDRGRVGEPDDDRVGILVLAGQDFGAFAAEDDLSAPLGEGGWDLAPVFVPFLLISVTPSFTIFLVRG